MAVIMQTFLRALATMSILLTRVDAAEPCPSAGNANAHPTFDAALLKEGRFTYHTTRKGESLGDTVIEVRRAGSGYRITMSAPEIAQSWEAAFRRSFAPLSARLSMRVRGAPYEMNLQYGAKITGEERRDGVVTAVNADPNGVVIDQRVDWASMMALKVTAGRSVTMRVFDPSTGFSAMLGKRGATEPMSGAWGDVTAVRLDYSICKREHVENYTVFATAATPRYMLREDMPNGLVSTLVRIEP